MALLSTTDVSERTWWSLWRTSLIQSGFTRWFMIHDTAPEPRPSLLVRMLLDEAYWVASGATTADALDLLRWRHALAVGLLRAVDGEILGRNVRGLEPVLEFILDHLESMQSERHPIVWFDTVTETTLRQHLPNVDRPSLILRAWSIIDH